jgi:hypothetical protein
VGAQGEDCAAAGEGAATAGEGAAGDGGGAAAPGGGTGGGGGAGADDGDPAGSDPGVPCGGGDASARATAGPIGPVGRSEIAIPLASSHLVRRRNHRLISESSLAPTGTGYIATDMDPTLHSFGSCSTTFPLCGRGPERLGNNCETGRLAGCLFQAGSADRHEPRFDLDVDRVA